MNTLNKRVAAGKSFLSEIAKPAIIVGTSLLISGCNFINQVGGLSTGEKVTGAVVGAGLIVVGYRGLRVIEQRVKKHYYKKHNKAQLNDYFSYLGLALEPDQPKPKRGLAAIGLRIEKYYNAQHNKEQVGEYLQYLGGQTEQSDKK